MSLRLIPNQFVLPAGTLELTILFADLRGYTHFAESRSAAEAFVLIERFVQTVAPIVDAHHGMLIDFAGDGIMAAFGLYDARGRKEHDAIDAGLTMLSVLRPRAGSDAWALELGVGVATGEVHVGTVRVERAEIIAVVGSATNLAARLQAWTRGADARIAVDEKTYRAAKRSNPRFRRRANTKIRGFSRAETVYCLPRDASGAANIGALAATVVARARPNARLGHESENASSEVRTCPLSL